MLDRIVRRLRRRGGEPVEMESASAYDLWSSTYDNDAENVLVHLDEEVFARLLVRLPLHGRTLIDVGCGTGRHWKTILAHNPAELVGYDVSPGMLARLRQKYPNAPIYVGSADALSQTFDRSCDIVMSTLMMSHVPSLEAAFREWGRVLRTRGDVLLTDLHPAAAASCEANFRHRARRIKVKTHIRPLEAIQSAAAESGFECHAQEERVIDGSLRPFYERANMLPVFERTRGAPLIYGLHLRRSD